MYLSRFIATLVAMATLLAASAPHIASAQGVLVDVRTDVQIRLPRPIPPWPHPHPRPRPIPSPPQGSYKVESIEVDARISDQVARVQVAQKFKNTGSTQMEVCFVFPIPYDGAIDSLTLLVDGKEFEARLLPADEARRTYEEIVRKNKDPALLEWLGTGMFKTSVFPVPAGAERTVTLEYSQLCRKSKSLTDFVFPLSTAKYSTGPLDKLRLRVAIDSSSPMTSVYSPTHGVKIDRSDDKHAVVTYESSNEIPTNDFRLLYDSSDQAVGASVISYRPDSDEPGYFLLLATPTIEKPGETKPEPKTVVFVVDRSGSMSGEKMEQARGALKFVLNNLREGDTFNIIAYDSDVETFRPELERFNDDTRQAALGFVQGIYAGGSTNIDGALQRALSMLKDSSRPNYVVFLTDGLPTTGERREAAIVENSEKANGVHARIFSFGVGYDVNSRLLDRLARSNFGLSEYVRPDEDIEAAVASLYNRIGAPVMTSVELSFDVEGASASDGAIVNRAYPKGEFDLFAGDQAVIVGRYTKSGTAKVKLTGKIAGEEMTMDFPAELIADSKDDTNAFVARLWAMRRVGEIIDEIDLDGKNDELVKELVALATQHGIVTEYTSFLADETSDHRDVAQNFRRAGERLERLSETAGRYAFSQRAAKNALQSAPADSASLGGLSGRALQPASEPAGSRQLARIRGNALYFDAEKEESRVVDNLRQIGRKTFFQRGEQWVDSAVSEEEEKKARHIERYSREYFDLADRYGAHVNQYLTIEEPVVVKLDGQVYQW